MLSFKKHCSLPFADDNPLANEKLEILNGYHVIKALKFLQMKFFVRFSKSYKVGLGLVFRIELIIINFYEPILVCVPAVNGEVNFVIPVTICKSARAFDKNSFTVITNNTLTIIANFNVDAAQR